MLLISFPAKKSDEINVTGGGVCDALHQVSGGP